MALTQGASDYGFWRVVFLGHDGETQYLAECAPLDRARAVAAHHIRRLRFKGAFVLQNDPGTAWEVENPNLAHGDGLLTLYPM